MLNETIKQLENLKEKYNTFMLKSFNDKEEIIKYLINLNIEHGICAYLATLYKDESIFNFHYKTFYEWYARNNSYSYYCVTPVNLICDFENNTNHDELKKLIVDKSIKPRLNLIEEFIKSRLIE